MNKVMISAACALLLSATFAVAQPSQTKGGAPMTGESAATPGSNMSNTGAGDMSKGGTPVAGKMTKKSKKKSKM